MLCESYKAPYVQIKDVLILILMEYALWALTFIAAADTRRVLILILMEYALWERSCAS